VKTALRIVAEAPIKVRVEFPVISGYRAPVVKVAGEGLELVANAHSVSCELEIGSQPLDLTVSYASALFNFPSEKLAQFPFFTETSAPGFTVVTNSMEELEKLSNDVKLREFVSFYQTVVKGKENAMPLMVTTEGVANQPVLKIKFDPAAAQPGIFMPQDNQIDFVVRNGAELQSYLDRFLAVLDERYPYHPGFVGTWGMDPNLLRHVKMMGENLESR
jgi:hypothetical protein